MSGHDQPKRPVTVLRNPHEEFEAWALANPDMTRATHFDVWKASREALVIELPEPYAVVGDYAACGGDRSVWDVEYAEKIDDRMCEKTPVYDRAGLEASGLKFK
jgi:hypothetical protein